jgi:hypothetical protein
MKGDKKKEMMLEHAKPAQFDSTFRKAEGNGCLRGDESTEVGASAKLHTPTS